MLNVVVIREEAIKSQVISSKINHFCLKSVSLNALKRDVLFFYVGIILIESEIKNTCSEVLQLHFY